MGIRVKCIFQCDGSTTREIPISLWYCRERKCRVWHYVVLIMHHLCFWKLGIQKASLGFYFTRAFFILPHSQKNKAVLSGWMTFLWTLEHFKYCGSLCGEKLQWGSAWLQVFLNTDYWLSCRRDLFAFIRPPVREVEVCLSGLSVQSKQYVAAEGNMVASAIWIPHWGRSSKEICVTGSGCCFLRNLI